MLCDRKTAIKMIKEAFPNFQITFENGDKIMETFDEANPPYKFTCKNLLVTAIKNV